MTSLCFGDMVRLLNEGRLYIPANVEVKDRVQDQIDDLGLDELKDYILSNYQQRILFLNPISINALPEPIYKDRNIIFPYGSLHFRLMDGLDRCFAIRRAWEHLKNYKPSEISDFAKLELVTLIYASLSLDEELKAYRNLKLSESD